MIAYDGYALLLKREGLTMMKLLAKRCSLAASPGVRKRFPKSSVGTSRCGSAGVYIHSTVFLLEIIQKRTKEVTFQGIQRNSKEKTHHV